MSSAVRRNHNDRSTQPLKFFKRPEIRQYFHKGLFWRSTRTGEPASFEIFLDLVYVGVIDIIGENAAKTPDGLSFLHFFIVFAIGWKIWSELTNIINWYISPSVVDGVALKRIQVRNRRHLPATIDVVLSCLPFRLHQQYFLLLRNDVHASCCLLHRTTPLHGRMVSIRRRSSPDDQGYVDLELSLDHRVFCAVDCQYSRRLARPISSDIPRTGRRLL